LKNNLERQVADQTHEITESYETTLEGWAKALELRDKETEGHSRRVIEETVQLARALDVPEEEIIHLRRGAILHDIGKMAIPDEILRKPARLTREERRIIEKHPETARQLLENIPYLKKALDIPYSHQERWDGSGYPLGLKGEQIPLAARIFAVVDVWDALLSDRSYSKAWSKGRTIEYIKANSAVLFDPRVVNAFLKLVGEESDSPDSTH
jgi:putative nucleotidyltransferase with HDIG domain